VSFWLPVQVPDDLEDVTNWSKTVDGDSVKDLISTLTISPEDLGHVVPIVLSQPPLVLLVRKPPISPMLGLR